MLAGSPPEGDQSRINGLDPELLVVGDPAVEGLGQTIFRGNLGLTKPVVGVDIDRAGTVVDDLHVTARTVDPAKQPLAPALARVSDPVAEDLQVAPFREVLRPSANNPFADLIAPVSTITILQLVLGRDDERWIGHDQVELEIAHRLEQVARDKVDVGDAVEQGVEPGDGDGAGIAVGAHDLLAVGGCRERLEAAPCAQVKGPSRRWADCHPREGQRGPGHPQDVIRSLASCGHRAIVSDHQLARRPQSDRTANRCSVQRDQSQVGPVGRIHGRDGPPEVVQLDGNLDQEHAK